MRIWFFFFLFILWLEGSFAAAGFTFVTSIPKSASYGKREVRIVSGNPSSWQYQACVADYQQIGKIYTLNINSNISFDLQPGVAPNEGQMNYALTVIQGLPECGYAALVNTTLYNVIGNDSREIALAEDVDGHWQPPFYAVWINNQVQTFMSTGKGVVNRFNVTTPGTYNYLASDDGMDLISDWELYQEPHSLTSYIAYYLTVLNNTVIKSVVHKCNPDCTRVMTLGTSAKDATITANSTHWFSCYKELDVSGGYVCTISGIPEWTFNMPQFDSDYPIGMSDDKMYSCMLNEDTLVVMLTLNGFNYTIYSLAPLTAFTIKSAISNTAYARSLTCVDNIILVGTWDGIDYYAWDNGTGIIFPSEPVPSTAPLISEPTGGAPTDAPIDTSLDTPVFVDTPIVTPNSAVNQNNTGELSANDKIAVGVVIGVGVPLIAGAVVLIVLRKKLNKKPHKPEEGSVYTAINKVHKLIPFKEIAFTKEIGAGSYGKVFLGMWQGKKVAVKMNNQIADAEGFMAEARLMLSVPLHPNLVETYGISMDTDHPYIVLEFCEGGSLDKIVFNKTIGHKEQRALVLGIAQGLLHLHSNKIVHRDLAVRNILLKDGVPKISDFGMSRVLKEEAAQGRTKNTVGPIRWMAPESIADTTYSSKSDVWTFGIVVSEIVLGHEPHHDKNQLDIAVKIRDVGFAPSIPDSCDPVLSELMQMCWKLDPDDRPTMHRIVEFLNDNANVEL